MCDTGVINPLRVFALSVPILRLIFPTYSALLVVERRCPPYGVAQSHLKLHFHSLGCTARLVYLRARAHMVMHALSATYKLCVEQCYCVSGSLDVQQKYTDTDKFPFSLLLVLVPP